MPATRTWVWSAGEVVPAEGPLWSGFDRGALYGDGLFETMLVIGGKPCDLAAHLRRFRGSADALGFPSPGELAALAGRGAGELLSHTGSSQGVLRITWTRRSDRRGYAPPADGAATVTVHLFPLPESWAERRRGVRAIVATGLSPGSLAAHKSTSSLVYVEAARRAHLQGADEALLEDGAGGLSEATSANLFAVIEDTLVTPPLSLPVLPGVTRAWVLDQTVLSSSVEERSLRARELSEAREAFLTSSVAGIVPLLVLDDQPIGKGTPGRWTLSLGEALDRQRAISGDV